MRWRASTAGFRLIQQPFLLSEQQDRQPKYNAIWRPAAVETMPLVKTPVRFVAGLAGACQAL